MEKAPRNFAALFQREMKNGSVRLAGAVGGSLHYLVGGVVDGGGSLQLILMAGGHVVRFIDFDFSRAGIAPGLDDSAYRFSSKTKSAV